jgi:hypothetical protein
MGKEGCEMPEKKPTKKEILRLVCKLIERLQTRPPETFTTFSGNLEPEVYKYFIKPKIDDITYLWWGDDDVVVDDEINVTLTRRQHGYAPSIKVYRTLYRLFKPLMSSEADSFSDWTLDFSFDISFRKLRENVIVSEVVDNL